MIYAKDEKNNIVEANMAKKGRKYYCSGCHGQVILRCGKLRVSHFAHKKHACDIFFEGETSEHLRGKKLLMTWLRKEGKDPQIEAYLTSLHQRPDILCNNKAFEFQCSPISVERMSERSKGYISEGYDFFWFLGKRHLIKKRLTQQIAQFIRWHKNLGFYLIYINVEQRNMEVYYHIQQADFLPVRFYRKKVNSWKELQDFFKQNRIKNYNLLSISERKRQKNCFYRNCLQSTNKFKELQVICYIHGYILQEIYEEISSERYTYPIYKEYIFTKKMYEKLNLKDIELYYQLPFINFSNID